VGQLPCTTLASVIKTYLKPESHGALDTVLSSAPTHTLASVWAALEATNHAASNCTKYHTRKALVCPALAPPVVTHRGRGTLTLALAPHHPMFSVPAVALEVLVDGAPRGRVQLPLGHVDTRLMPMQVNAHVKLHGAQALLRNSRYTHPYGTCL
jgi:hypothetical protein